MHSAAKSCVLIVDDTESNIDVLIEALDGEYDIRVATDGESALEVIQSENLDLILLDIMMPGMDGYEVCRRLKADPKTKDIPVIFLTAKDRVEDETKGLRLGAVDYITKPINPSIVKARVQAHLALYSQNRLLEEKVKQRTAELEASKVELQVALKNLKTTKVTPGVFWIQVPEAGLYILCGCPAEIVKHLMTKGYIAAEKKEDVFCETGPNAILLSDVLIQNGGFSNLAEFPVLQMLYRQGLALPNHPNNTGQKPILIGSQDQLKAQMNYIHRGNYGLISKEEIMATGVPEKDADEMMQIKKRFTFGKTPVPEDLIDSVVVNDDKVEIRNGVFVRRTGFNRYEFTYKERTTTVDLNLGKGETYASPYTMGFHNVKREYFAVIQSGQGDGWDTRRPSMGSILMYQGSIFLVDVTPNILHTLSTLGIDISEVEGIFHTHAHDDHFAGLPNLLQADHRIKYYATPLVRASVTKKFCALMSMEEYLFEEFFEIHDLAFNVWNDCDGLEVKPLYSPHPVETNIFIFRALGENGYKTYAHFADIIALDLFEKWVEDSQGGISRETFERIKAEYLTPVNLKKLDIGGGLIHGQAKDFKDDTSEKIILSHTNSELSAEDKEIGSESSFGAIDVLISNSRDYSRIHASRYLKSFFPALTDRALSVLLNSKTASFNDGTIILKRGSDVREIYLILIGSVDYIDSKRHCQYKLSNGCFIGEQAFFSASPAKGTYRAVSHVSALCFSKAMFRRFLEKNDIYKETKAMIENINFLQSTWLFGEESSYAVQNKLSQVMLPISFDRGDGVDVGQSQRLFLIEKGEIQVTSTRNHVIENLKAGDFFGENQLFEGMRYEVKFTAIKPASLYSVPGRLLLEIPNIHWKLLEICSKRRKQVELRQ